MASSCVASIIRLYALYKVSFSTDQSWDVPVIVIWSCIELNTGVICIGLGSLKPLISRYLPGLLGSSHATEASNIYSRKSRYIRPLDEQCLRRGGDIEFSDNLRDGRSFKSSDQENASSSVQGLGRSHERGIEL
jgi:hypothetical protein